MSFHRRPEATRDSTIGTPEWRRHHRADRGKQSHHAPSLVLRVGGVRVAADVDRLTVVASFAGTLALLVIGEVLQLHDRFTGGGPAAEVRRFLAHYPDADVIDLTVKES